jgi:hypothetical protein
MRMPRTTRFACIALAALAAIALASVPLAAKESAEDYRPVGFDVLATFPFKSPPILDAKAPTEAASIEVMKQVPESVRKLEGQKVVITGFMLPVKIERGLATEFLLLNTPLMCCFGVTPPTNAWVIVKMPKGTPAQQDVPLPFRGRLHVRPQWDNGYLASIYQLDGEALAKPAP